MDGDGRGPRIARQAVGEVKRVKQAKRVKRDDRLYWSVTQRMKQMNVVFSLQ